MRRKCRQTTEELTNKFNNEFSFQDTQIASQYEQIIFEKDEVIRKQDEEITDLKHEYLRLFEKNEVNSLIFLFAIITEVISFPRPV